MYRLFLKNPHGNRPLAMADAEHLTTAADEINSAHTPHSYQTTLGEQTVRNCDTENMTDPISNTVDVRSGAATEQTELRCQRQQSQTHVEPRSLLGAFCTSYRGQLPFCNVQYLY